ncbi:MAG: bifunctional demethylmenaquinone methyltransferase/2-methoxy-6-polyprenyl-1,4-benzoquinol methylase UbiE [Chlamydiales bacterium]|nr:bifunctional demethylmenaquinone methyltransferase/2-methoxy-6-polyprenyl-1,4-benzoquinol methylase UbiE [Chlamydiales bacterium]NCF71409.1 bifunctional demethylmenaquinone methyltransferase/2-methoxy-6-polyprenyl-1,4-benzoquinol methylase UbiE [Chlamydiales bacterium]
MKPLLKEYKTQDPQVIKSLFASIAHSYDRTNSIMSGFLHKWWNRRLIDSSFADKREGPYLDLCSGTGAIALAYLEKQSQKKEVTLADFCPQMLDEAKKKAIHAGLDSKHQLRFVEADAQELPFEDNSFDCITMAYGLRNIKDPARALSECFRVLKPSGRLAILELTRPRNFLFKKIHASYLHHILPIMGRLFSQNQEAYEYLSESIQQFVSPTQLKHLLLEIGFKKSKSQSLTFGTAHIIFADK